jgi:hypothetical protein
MVLPFNLCPKRSCSAYLKVHMAPCRRHQAHTLYPVSFTWTPSRQPRHRAFELNRTSPSGLGPRWNAALRPHRHTCCPSAHAAIQISLRWEQDCPVTASYKGSPLYQAMKEKGPRVYSSKGRDQTIQQTLCLVSTVCPSRYHVELQRK